MSIGMLVGAILVIWCAHKVVDRLNALEKRVSEMGGTQLGMIAHIEVLTEEARERDEMIAAMIGIPPN